MTTIRQAAAIAESTQRACWLHQVNRNLPYGDLVAMVMEARGEGASVTQARGDRFLVDNRAWVSVHGCVNPVRTSNL